MESLNILEPVIRAASAANAKKTGDFIKDGLLHCGMCHTPKQCRKTFLGREVVVGCMCACSKSRYEQDEADRKKGKTLTE